MKRMLLILTLLPALAFASGWDNYSGTAMSPVVSGYYNYLQATDSIKTQLLAPRIANTGSIGKSGNAWDAVWADTVNTAVVQSLSGAAITFKETDTLKLPAGPALIIGNNRFYDGGTYLTSDGGLQGTYIYGTGAVSSAGYVHAATEVISQAAATGIFKNNEVRIKVNIDNPYITFSDSATGAARTRDSLVYGGSAFTFSDTVKVPSLSVGGGTMLTGIYTGNATGWTAENTVDTNVVSGATVASRISLTFRSATATLTAPLTGVTVVDSLFIACIAADTALLRAGSVDFDCHK